MADLLDGLLTILEFILLGGIATIVLLYAFIWIHPVKHALSGYYRDSKSFLFDTNSDTFRLKTTIIVALATGYLYFAGSITNATGYWLMEPAHNSELSRFYWSLRTKDRPKECELLTKAQTQQIPAKQWMILQRIVWSRNGSECEKLAYATTLSDEASWRTLARESASDGLDGLVKHIRLARGAAVCALGITGLALLKTAGAICVLLVTLGPVKWAKFLYRGLIDEKALDTVQPEEIRNKTRGAFGVYLITALLGIGAYLICVESYMNVEREFHGLAYFGAEAAKEKVKGELSAAHCLQAPASITSGSSAEHTKQ